MRKMSEKITYKSIYALIILTLVGSLLLFPIKVQAATSYTQTVKNGIENFPDSYKKLLNDFMDKTDHTNWNFQAYYTGIDWADFINGEVGKNRVLQSWDSAYQDPKGNLASGWFTANSDITAYFADPRNFINERNLFEFLDESYNPTLYTKDIIDGMISSLKVFNNGNPITFTMDDTTSPDYGKQVVMTYSDIIMEAAKESQMSPINIVVKIVQEVGSNGSNSVSGTYSGYEGYYNFFNVGATDTGDPIANGLTYAKTKAVSAQFPDGWNNPYNSIIGGALFNSTDYIQKGQNTAYFYKFDCVGTKILNVGETQTISSGDLYHQYMTNVMDPYSQSWSLFDTYTNNDLLSKPLNFIIPIYNNMPDKVYKPSSLSNSTDPLYYANISSSLTVRSNATTNYSTIMNLYRDDLVVMLKRNYATVSGVSLDQVELWNGQTGYVATQYLEPFSKLQNIKVDDTQIIITPDVTADSVASALNTSTYIVKSGDTDVTSTKVLGTGYKFIVGDASYTIIKPGDVTGDGLINIADLVAVRMQMLDDTKFTGVFKEAANLSKYASSGNASKTDITIADLVAVRQYMLGNLKFTSLQF